MNLQELQPRIIYSTKTVSFGVQYSLGSLGTSPPIKSEIAYSIPPRRGDTVSDLRLDRWAGTETTVSEPELWSHDFHCHTSEVPFFRLF